MSAMRSIHLVMKAKKSNVPFFLVVLQAMYAGLKNHPQLFTTTPIDLAIFLSQIQTLAALQQAVKGGPKGAAAARNTARDVCFASAETLRVYVETLCLNAPEQSVTLAQAAGLSIRAVPARHKPVLGVKQGSHPGEVLLSANASALVLDKKSRAGRFFNWGYSLNGKDWIAAVSTTKTTTTLSGLPPLTLVSFRVSVTESKTGPGEWSQVVTFGVK
jgi:hypothetical protein